MRLDHRSFLRLSGPFILASITTSLLGAVGTAVVGHLGNVDYIGAVALGTVIFNTLYWMFNFLRIVTASYSSQAYGRRNAEEAALALLRPGMIALAFGILMLLLSPLIAKAFILALRPDAEIKALALGYFRILIWGAPLVLASFSLLGWLMGRMRLKAVLFLQIGTNLFNCALYFVFVYGFRMDVTGVAIATLIAQAASFLAGLWLVLATDNVSFRGVGWREVLNRRGIAELMSTNFYLWLRTGCMMVMVNVFMARSASFGPTVLAANAILFQIQYIMGDVLDGFANASGVYSGLALGGTDRRLFRSNVFYTGFWSAAAGISLCLVYLALDEHFLPLFTDLPGVLAVVSQYSVYVALYPLLAAAGVEYTGLFNGALKTRPVCVAMILSLAVFLVCDFLLVPSRGNRGLWEAFTLFYVGRTAFLLMYMPSLMRKLA
ncbi:MAG: MATE family efflux transporter [Deltaproteobacteria bacterium]|nr:MATE family efflux transporter [Deltaproteobacteria bacterium]